jgi:FMN-dependent NADH-azoreductase
MCVHTHIIWNEGKAMNKLLHVSASPRGQASESLRIATVFTEAFIQAKPHSAVEQWDLWDGSLPNFAVGARAKMTVFAGARPDGAEAVAWTAAQRAFERFDAADRLLFSVPMWNAGLPYVLKQFIDVISQPGWIFDVHPETGYRHLLADRGKRVAVIYTSAVWAPELGPEFGSDFQSSYFTEWLRWTGLSDIREIRYHPTLTGDRDAARQTAETTARNVASTF